MSLNAWWARLQVCLLAVVSVVIALGIQSLVGFLPQWDVEGTYLATFLWHSKNVIYALCVPYIGTYTIALLIWPPFLINKDGATAEKIETVEDGNTRRFHMRFVTRGLNPKLVADCCRDLHDLFQSLQMPTSQYSIEVATDNVINCAALSGVPVEEIVVPTSYRTANGTKWKARALQYALETVSSSDDDWIVHLDEETMMDKRTVAAIWSHAEKEMAAVASGERKIPDIGQGAMLYGTGKHGPIENWITTLADSIRVTDDFGSFRLAFFKREFVTFGMKGSFVVMNQVVAKAVSWDLGPELSLTEDAAFNMIALKQNISTTWIDAMMYEQSPFTLKDFVRQRERWFAGLVLCLRSPQTRSWHITPMFFKMVLWALSPLFVSAFFIDIFTRVYPVNVGCWVFVYLLGFFVTYSPRDGIMRWLGIFCMQLLGIPLFATLDAAGAYCGVMQVLRGKAGTEFHIVKKEVGSAEESSTKVPAKRDNGHAEKSSIKVPAKKMAGLAAPLLVAASPMIKDVQREDSSTDGKSMSSTDVNEEASSVDGI